MTAIQKNGGLLDPLIKIAAGLGIVQGIVWTLLSLTSILLYQTDIKVTTDSISTIGSLIYQYYLYKPHTHIDGIILTSKEFNYFMYFYLVLSVGWCVASTMVLWVILKGKIDKYFDGSIASWTVFAGLLSLLDLILLCILSHDYAKYQSMTQVTQLELTALGVLMTITARGFVLWIINVIFAVILGKHWYQRYTTGVQNRPPIGAYSGGPDPWNAKPPNMYDDSNSLGFDNKGFRDDGSDATFGPDPRMQHQPMGDRNPRNNYSNNNNHRNNVDRNRNVANTREFPPDNLRRPIANNDNYWNNRNQARDGPGLSSRPYTEAGASSPYGLSRTAKIGRQGGQRSPPLNVAPPNIPDPDYSPPGSPKVRGVLRPKSNYMY